MNSDFEKELTTVINKHNVDGECNTPDYILADYLVGCIDSFRRTKTKLDNAMYEQLINILNQRTVAKSG